MQEAALILHVIGNDAHLAARPCAGHDTGLEPHAMNSISDDKDTPQCYTDPHC